MTMGLWMVGQVSAELAVQAFSGTLLFDVYQVRVELSLVLTAAASNTTNNNERRTRTTKTTCEQRGSCGLGLTERTTVWLNSLKRQPTKPSIVLNRTVDSVFPGAEFCENAAGMAMESVEYITCLRTRYRYRLTREDIQHGTPRYGYSKTFEYKTGNKWIVITMSNHRKHFKYSRRGKQS